MYGHGYRGLAWTGRLAFNIAAREEENPRQTMMPHLPSRQCFRSADVNAV